MKENHLVKREMAPRERERDVAYKEQIKRRKWRKRQKFTEVLAGKV